MAAPAVLQMVTGGIAAYKACWLTRLLVQAGFSVRVAMTAAAQRFVSPLTFRVLSQHPVATDLWGEGQTQPLDHIEYARGCAVAVVAPATANILAKAAAGLADDIVSTLLLAYEGPLIVAPAMNDAMLRHPATRANLACLRQRGVIVVEPAEGFLACGTHAEGRLAAPEALLAAVEAAARTAPVRPVPDGSVAAVADRWAGQRVVVTAGPTHEPIDAVRYIANRSTGVFGFAIAADAAARGARVTLIAGPTALDAPAGVEGFVRVRTAEQLAAAVREALAAGADWLFMAAAVADYAPEQVEMGKLRKESLGTSWNLALRRTPDILGDVVNPDRKEGLRVVGFALETGEVLERAAKKLKAKGMDFVVANDPTAPGAGFGDGVHRAWLLGPAGQLWDSGPSSKRAIACGLLDRLAALTGKDGAA